MIVFCLWAYLRLKDKRWSDLAVLIGSGAVAIGYFVLIIALTGRQYLPLMRKVFRI